jgi:hypothetical protein
MAYTGIANSYFQNKQFKKSMDSYKLANNRTGYSKAYKSYRNVMAIAYFKYIFLIFLLLVVLLIIILKRYDKKRDDKTEYKNLYLYPLYLIAHPFEAFYCMKFQKRGRISISIIILAVFTAVFIVNRQFTGFIFNYSNPESINIYDEIMRVAVPFILWIISNWCISSLVDGEGRINEIVNYSAYSLTPMIIVLIITTVLSNYFTVEEGTFLSIIMGAGMIFTVLLLFIGTLQTHQLTGKGTLWFIIGTLVGMFIIAFITLLFIYLVNNMYDFFARLYVQLIYG